MSAFVLHKRHIDLLVQAIVEPLADEPLEAELDRDLLFRSIKRLIPASVTAKAGSVEDAIGQVLLDQNVRSVQCRYPADQRMVPEYATRPYRYESLPFRPTVVEVAKAIECYQYQACETDDWENTLAYRITEQLRNSLPTRMAGYEQAPWEWTDEQIAARTGLVSR